MAYFFFFLYWFYRRVTIPDVLIDQVLPILIVVIYFHFPDFGRVFWHPGLFSQISFFSLLFFGQEKEFEVSTLLLEESGFVSSLVSAVVPAGLFWFAPGWWISTNFGSNDYSLSFWFSLLTRFSSFPVFQVMGSMVPLFDRAILPSSRTDVLPFDWPFLRLLRSGSPAWVPEVDARFLTSTARRNIKQWICFICRAVFVQSYDLCAHLENQHPQMHCTFSMNPQLFPRCLMCSESLFLVTLFFLLMG